MRERGSQSNREFDEGEIPATFMEHPLTVLHLEHDGKILLVDEDGQGPRIPVMGRRDGPALRLPTSEEAHALGIPWQKIRTTTIKLVDETCDVIKATPLIEWPEHWAWKDEAITDDSVHPFARESIYRSLHRLVSKVVVRNDAGMILMGKVKRGHFVGHWSLPGGYMDHDEHPENGCVRETFEEFGIEIELNDDEPVVSPKIFNRDGISFVSFTYHATWNGGIEDLNLKEDEISEAAWLTLEQAKSRVVSEFGRLALESLN